MVIEFCEIAGDKLFLDRGGFGDLVFFEVGFGDLLFFEAGFGDLYLLDFKADLLLTDWDLLWLFLDPIETTDFFLFYTLIVPDLDLFCIALPWVEYIFIVSRFLVSTFLYLTLDFSLTFFKGFCSFLTSITGPILGFLSIDEV